MYYGLFLFVPKKDIKARHHQYTAFMIRPVSDFRCALMNFGTVVFFFIFLRRS